MSQNRVVGQSRLEVRAGAAQPVYWKESARGRHGR